MSDKYLHRADAPFGEKVWKAIDDVVIAAAKSTLTARRLMPIEGPYGLGMKFFARADATTKKGAATPLTLIHGLLLALGRAKPGLRGQTWVVPAGGAGAGHPREEAAWTET